MTRTTNARLPPRAGDPSWLLRSSVFSAGSSSRQGERMAVASPPSKTMGASVWTDGSALSSVADTALQIAARFWFLVAVAGQWIFVVYVVVFYGGAAIQGDWVAWNRVMPRGYVPGHPIGNLVVAIHLFLAVVILVGGPLQLIPRIRRYPVFSSLERAPIHAGCCRDQHCWSLYGLVSRTRRRCSKPLYQPSRIPDDEFRCLRRALCHCARYQHASPVGAPPVHGGECRLVFPGWPDAVDSLPSRLSRLRSRDVHWPVPQFHVCRRLRPAAGHSRNLSPNKRPRRRE